MDLNMWHHDRTRLKLSKSHFYLSYIGSFHTFNILICTYLTTLCPRQHSLASIFCKDSHSCDKRKRAHQLGGFKPTTSQSLDKVACALLLCNNHCLITNHTYNGALGGII